jgi:hypothetical protein
MVDALDLIKKNSTAASAKLESVEIYKLQSEENKGILYEALELFTANIEMIRTILDE